MKNEIYNLIVKNTGRADSFTESQADRIDTLAFSQGFTVEVADQWLAVKIGDTTVYFGTYIDVLDWLNLNEINLAGVAKRAMREASKKQHNWLKAKARLQQVGNRGFTLIELIAVIIVITILAGVLVNNVSWTRTSLPNTLQAGPAGLHNYELDKSEDMLHTVDTNYDKNKPLR